MAISPSTPKHNLSDARNIKLNLGCGHNKMQGFINVDASAACNPDLVYDLEKTPWPWEANSVSEVVFFHALEHIGPRSQDFFMLMQELYRVCCHDALVKITVPHPRHDNFVDDPTHVRIITPRVMSLFSRANCDLWKSQGASNTPMAHYLDVDFQTIHAEVKLDEPYATALANGQIQKTEAATLLRERNNVGLEYIIHLQVIKT